VIALLLPPRQFGLKIIFGYTSIGDADPSVVQRFLPIDVSTGQALQAQTRLDIFWHLPWKQIVVAPFLLTRKSKEPGYIRSSYKRCAERISVVGTRPDRLQLLLQWAKAFLIGLIQHLQNAPPGLLIDRPLSPRPSFSTRFIPSFRSQLRSRANHGHRNLSPY
jgi:hypothetical protein